jgi:hypothetical protein
MSNRDDGGPAFPVDITGVGMTLLGMSLRDYMAIHAPVSEIQKIFPSSAQDVAEWIAPSVEAHSQGKGQMLFITKARYIWADAMLEAREK